MIKLKETIVAEGKYDKIKLQSIFDTSIITTGGFNIYKNKKIIELLRKIADKNGIIIITDSDSSGFKIRNYIKNCLSGKNVKHVFIPEIKGKEKRKSKASSEGLLGVEAMDEETIKKAFLKCGITENAKTPEKPEITKLDLYKAGLYGREKSSEKRKEFLKNNGFPEKISANMLIEILNSLGIDLPEN